MLMAGTAAVLRCCVLCRSCSETTEVTDIGPYKVPEGIVVWPMIYALQNSINNWEDPEDFNPVSGHTFQILSCWGFEMMHAGPLPMAPLVTGLCTCI
jgi:hypothetical protein